MDHETTTPAPGEEPSVEQSIEWPEPTQSEIDEAEQEEKAREVYEKQQRTQGLIDSTKRMFVLSDAIAGRWEAEKEAEGPEEEASLQDIIDKNISPGKRAQVKLLTDSWNAKLADVQRGVEQDQTNYETELKRHFGKYRPITNDKGEVIAIEEPDKKRKAPSFHKSKNTKSTTLKRSGGPTRYVSPRDKGAPAHIAKQIRGDDN